MENVSPWHWLPAPVVIATVPTTSPVFPGLIADGNEVAVNVTTLGLQVVPVLTEPADEIVTVPPTALWTVTGPALLEGFVTVTWTFVIESPGNRPLTVAAVAGSVMLADPTVPLLVPEPVDL